MEAETLRDLISRKHPRARVLWLSSPGLLKHSKQSIEKRVCTQRGAPWTGWAGELQSPAMREVQAAVLPEQRLSCVSSLLPVSSLQRWKTTCPYPPQSRAGIFLPVITKAFLSLSSCPSKQHPKETKWGTAVLAHRCAQVICVHCVRKQLSQPFAHCCCVMLGEQKSPRCSSGNRGCPLGWG